jgi:hypothetical protein
LNIIPSSEITTALMNRKRILSKKEAVVHADIASDLNTAISDTKNVRDVLGVISIGYSFLLMPAECVHWIYHHELPLEREFPGKKSERDVQRHVSAICDTRRQKLRTVLKVDCWVRNEADICECLQLRLGRRRCPSGKP